MARPRHASRPFSSSSIRRAVIAVRDPNPKVSGRRDPGASQGADGRFVAAFWGTRRPSDSSLRPGPARGASQGHPQDRLDPGRHARRRRWTVPMDHGNRGPPQTFGGFAKAPMPSSSDEARSRPTIRGSVRGIRPGRSPSRIVIDSRLSIDPDCRLSRDLAHRGGKAFPRPHPRRPPSATGSLVPAKGRTRALRPPAPPDRGRRRSIAAAPDGLRTQGVGGLGASGWPAGRVDLPALARRAARRGADRPARRAGSHARRSVSGQWSGRSPSLLFVAPMILGGNRGWTGKILPGPSDLPWRSGFHLDGSRVRIGNDLLLRWEGPAGRPLVPPRRGP